MTLSAGERHLYSDLTAQTEAALHKKYLVSD